MPVNPTKTEVLDREFLELRAELLQAAARLDRLDRGSGEISGDPRLIAIQQAIKILAGSIAGRAEQVQLIFSRRYDPNWKEQLKLTTNH